MKNKLALIFIVILGLSLYALTLRGVKGNPQPQDFKNQLDQNGQPFELSPERGRFVHILALAESHTFALTRQLANIAYPDVGYHGDKFFSFFAPGIPYMAYPLYLIGAHYHLGQVASFAFVSLMSILALLFLFKIAREILKLPVWASLLAVVIFAFGSTAWSYAVTLYQHHVTAFFLLSAFYAVWKYKHQARGSWLWAVWAWLAYGLSITIDYPNAVLLLPVMIYFLVVSFRISKDSEKIKISLRAPLLLTFAAFILVIGPLAAFNQHYLGSWHTLTGSLPALRTIVEAQQANPDTVVLGPGSTVPEKDVAGFFHQENFMHGLTVLLFSGDRGLFLYAPIFLLAILGFVLKFSERLDLESGFLLGVVLTNLFLYSSWGDPWGGWAYGPRYLIPGMAILSLFVVYALAKAKWKWSVRIAAFVLFAYSCAVALLGALTTNAIPPKVEAVPLHTPDNFLRNWLFFRDGRSDSFLYNYFFGHVINLRDYALVIYALLLIIFVVFLFVVPRFEHES
jgi:hypothetical protein